MQGPLIDHGPTSQDSHTATLLLRLSAVKIKKKYSISRSESEAGQLPNVPGTM